MWFLFMLYDFEVFNKSHAITCRVLSLKFRIYCIDSWSYNCIHKSQRCCTDLATLFNLLGVFLGLLEQYCKSGPEKWNSTTYLPSPRGSFRAIALLHNPFALTIKRQYIPSSSSSPFKEIYANHTKSAFGKKCIWKCSRVPLSTKTQWNSEPKVVTSHSTAQNHRGEVLHHQQTAKKAERKCFSFYF